MKKYKTEVKWAFIYCITTIVWAAIGKLLGFHSSKIEYNFVFNALNIIPSFIIYWFALDQKRKVDYYGVITYRQSLMGGMILTLFITVLGPLTPIATIEIISPDLFNDLIQYSVDSGMMSLQEAKNQFNITAFIITGVIAAPVFGLIFSLIASIFIHKRSVA